jgi:hypothetical protein
MPARQTQSRMPLAVGVLPRTPVTAKSGEVLLPSTISQSRTQAVEDSVGKNHQAVRSRADVLIVVGVEI